MVAVGAGADCKVGVVAICSEALKGRGIAGNPGGAAFFEAPAQLGHDVAAQPLDLVEDHLEWQAGVVDQKELALVVADPVGEAQGALDDLLGGAYG